MLQAVSVKLIHIRPLGLSCVRQLHVFNGIYTPQAKIPECPSMFFHQWHVHSKMKFQSLSTITSVSNSLCGFMQYRSLASQTKTPSRLNCRIIQPDEFNKEFEDLIFGTYMCSEPLMMHLGLTEPDECIMLWIRHVLQRAKEDGLSLGIYDVNNEQGQDQNGKQRPQLPVGYIINIVESIDDPPAKKTLTLDLDKAPADKRFKYVYVVNLLNKASEGLDLYAIYKARRLLQSFWAGVHPRYSNQGLYTRLKSATIELARANNIDLIYSKGTSEYITRANLKLGFHKARAIDYISYKNAEGLHIFTDIAKPHKACTITVKNLQN